MSRSPQDQSVRWVIRPTDKKSATYSDDFFRYYNELRDALCGNSSTSLLWPRMKTVDLFTASCFVRKVASEEELSFHSFQSFIQPEVAGLVPLDKRFVIQYAWDRFCARIGANVQEGDLVFYVSMGRKRGELNVMQLADEGAWHCFITCLLLYGVPVDETTCTSPFFFRLIVLPHGRELSEVLSDETPRPDTGSRPQRSQTHVSRRQKNLSDNSNDGTV